MSYVSEKIEDGLGDIFDVIKGAWDSVRSFAEFLVTWDFDDLEAAFKTFFRDVLAPVFKPIFDFLGFDAETVYTQEVVTTPLISKEAKYLESHLVNSILNGTDYADTVLLGIQSSQKLTLRAFLNYGEHHYSRGLPTVTLSEYFTDTEVVDDVLTTIEGEAVTVSNVIFSVPHAGLWAQDYMIDNYSYSLATDELTEGTEGWVYVSAAVNGGETGITVSITRDVSTRVVIDDYTQVLLDPTEFTDTWQRTTTTVTYTPAGAPDVTVVDGSVTRNATATGGPYTTTFVNVSDVTTPTTENSTLATDVPIYNSGGYYGALYSLDSAPSVDKIWFYEVALGTYPELDNELIGGDFDGMETLPIIELRRDFVNIDSDTTSEDYLTTKKILDILNIATLDELLESITDNPSIALIQDAYLLFGVNLYTEDQRSLRYLYGFFFTLSALPRFSKTEFDALTESDKSNANWVYMVSEGAYNVAITGNYIEITEVTGYIGKIGFTESEFTITANSEAVVVDLTDRTDPATADPDDSLGLVNSIFTVRTQLTENTYSEIEVSGLLITTHIVTTGTDVGIKAIEMVDPVTGDDADKANFIIPISYYILRQMPFTDVEQVIYDACSMVIYAEEVTELAYYQTEDFLDFVSVAIDAISVFLTIISLGTASGPVAALTTFLKHLLVRGALTYALREALSHNLSDTEKVAVALLYVLVNRRVSGVGSFADALADNLLLLVNSITTVFEIDLANKTQDLLEEQAELESLQETRQAELEAAQDYLNLDGTIDTFALLEGRTVAVLDTSISPEDFYNKSLLTNVAPIIYSQTSTYVASVLDLDNISTDFSRESSTDFNLLTELT